MKCLLLLFCFFVFCFCGNLVLVSWQDSFHHRSWILWANRPQSPPSLLQDYSICNNARLISPQFLHKAFWSKVGGLNIRPLSHESSALTTRPRLLVTVTVTVYCFDFSLQPNLFSLQSIWQFNTIRQLIKNLLCFFQKITN
jgi:hypothetical protein